MKGMELCNCYLEKVKGIKRRLLQNLQEDFRLFLRKRTNLFVEKIRNKGNRNNLPGDY